MAYVITVAEQLQANKQEIANLNKSEWTAIQHAVVPLAADGDIAWKIVFTGIPDGIAQLKLEGTLVADPVQATWFGLRFNGDETAVYGWTKVDMAFGSGYAPTQNTSDIRIPFTSGWANKERAVWEMIVEAPAMYNFSTGNDGHVMRSSTYNNGGSGDIHLCGANINLAERISSIEVQGHTLSGVFGEGTDLLLSAR